MKKIFIILFIQDLYLADKKIITINNATDKIIEQVKSITDKYPENVFLIFFSNILEKKSKLRNFFETNNKASMHSMLFR